MSGTIGESYAANMLATRGRQQDDIDPIEPIGRGIQTVAPVGAIKVAVERNDAKVLQKINVLASAAGSRFYYRFPVKNKDGTTSTIEGPSIDCALAVARTWGNCDVDVRVTDEGEHWIFLARFRDFETGFTLSRAFQQRKGQVTMKTKDPGRALDIVFQIGQSKAIRNVICNALGDVTDFAFDAAKSAFVDRIGSKVEHYRAKSLERLAELRIDVKRVEAILGKPAKQWLAPELARVIAELQAIQDNMSSADDLYPLLVDQSEQTEQVAKEEPTRAKPAVTTATAQTSDPGEKVNTETGEVTFDADAFVTVSEETARAATSLTALTDLDADVSAKIADADPDLVRYWRRVVGLAQKRIGEGVKAQEAKAGPAPAEDATDLTAEVETSAKRIESCLTPENTDEIMASELERLRDLGGDETHAAAVINAAKAHRLRLQKDAAPKGRK